MPIHNRIPRFWSASQRGVILAILLGLLIYGSIRLFLNRAYISNPQTTTPTRAADLADRINPNDADAPTLAVLPLIGEKRAADIVAYRERHVGDHLGEPVFKSVEDLQKVRGIGPATVEQIRPYLIFPTTAPSTQP